ncbi:TolB family protein, partial [Fibrobacterota bacterium]
MFDFFKKKCNECGQIIANELKESAKFNGLCQDCTESEIENTLRKRCHQSFVLRDDEREKTCESSSKFEVKSEAIGIFDGFKSVYETARFLPKTGNYAWSDLDTHGKGTLIVDKMSRDIPGGLAGKYLNFSQNGKGFGYIINAEDFSISRKNYLVWNNDFDRTNQSVIEVECNFMSILTLSPGGNAYAFISSNNGRYNVHVKDEMFGPFNGFSDSDEHPIAFSKDGEHFGFLTNREGVIFALIDGNELGPYRGVDKGPVFSEDGKRYVFDVGIDGGCAVIDTGNTGKLHDIIFFHASMDPKGSVVVYSARNNNKCQIFLNGDVIETFSNIIGIPRISPDAKKIAMIKKLESDFEVLVDNKLINSHKSPEEIIPQSFLWSPDSNRFAYF